MVLNVLCHSTYGTDCAISFVINLESNDDYYAVTNEFISLLREARKNLCEWGGKDCLSMVRRQTVSKMNRFVGVHFTTMISSYSSIFSIVSNEGVNNAFSMINIPENENIVVKAIVSDGKKKVLHMISEII